MKLSQLRSVVVLIFAATFLPLVLSAQAPARKGLTWMLTGEMNENAFYHTANLLQNGMVLVTSGTDMVTGRLPVGQLYDPASGSWSSTGTCLARIFHTGTLLHNGKVMVAGGSIDDAFPQVTPGVQLYEPSTNTWTSTSDMLTERENHSAVLLGSGDVLVAGGKDDAGHDLATAELFRPAGQFGSWSATGSMQTGRSFFQLTLLSDGRVLASGGQNGSTYVSDVEIYDPATGTWTVTGSLLIGRYSHTATLLPSGQVLVAGGLGQSPRVLAEAELYDPATGVWTATTPLNFARDGHRATLLAGRVIVTGGAPPNVANSWEMYDPGTATWKFGRLNGSHSGHTATLLRDQTILVAGGNTHAELSAEIGAITH